MTEPGEPSSPRPEVGALLRRHGVTDASELALGKTITPGTFARLSSTVVRPDERAEQETMQRSSAAAISASIGPLPRIALSGAAVLAAEEEERRGGAPADFEVLRVLGEGGMGRVHLARQRSLGRDVAIKSLKEEVADTRVAEMLRAEATVMGRLEHPNVVPVHAVGLDERGRLVLVMKRIDGVSWSELLKDKRHPRWPTLLASGGDQLEFHLDVLGALARALHFAHQEGVIHRDVKPDNVLVGAHGDVYLADWGVALRTSEGRSEPELVGTPSYMCREMVAGDPSKIDGRSDVALLGATMHEVLTGSPPYLGQNLQQILIAAYDGEPREYRDEVPSELAQIARKAMAAEPGDRYPTALAFKRAIDDVRRHRGSIALAKSGRALLAEIGEGESDDGAMDRKLTEARFAFVQALRDWPENAEAKAGLHACLKRSITHEIARENPAGARGLLAELPGGDAWLATEIEALERTLKSRAEARQRLERMEHEQDLTVGHGTRTALVVGLLVLTVLLSIAIGLQSSTGNATLTVDDQLFISAFLLVMSAVPILVWRKRLLVNAVNQRLAGLVVLSSALLFFHRLMGQSWGLSPDQMLATDFAIFLAITGASGSIVPRMGWGMLVPLIGAALAALMPAYVAPIFSMTGVFTLLVLTLLLMSSYQAPPRAK